MFSLIPWQKKNAGRAVSTFDRPFQLMHDDFQNLFERFFGNWPMDGWNDGMSIPRAWGLTVDENADKIAVRAELPGFEAEEIDVELKENVLTIEAKHEVKDGKEDDEHRHYTNHVRRRVTLPADLDFDAPEAQYRNGVLELNFARLPEAKGRRIEIKT